VFDIDGRKEFSADSQTMHIPPGTAPGRREWLGALRLRPGRYNLRFAVHSAARDKAGSVYTDVAVPDFAGGPLSWSGVAIGLRPGPVAVPPDTFARLLPFVPTTVREFGAHDAVTAFARLYWGRGSPETPVDVRMEIRNEKDAVVFDRTDRVTPSAGRSADCRLDLPIAGLPSGEYLFAWRAVPPKGQEIRRDVRFRVR